MGPARPRLSGLSVGRVTSRACWKDEDGVASESGGFENP